MTTIDKTQSTLDEMLSYLKLAYMRQNYESLATQASQKQWTHINYLAELATAEANLRGDRATQRRTRTARFPQIKTLEQFKWSWPKKVNQLQVKNLFRLRFITTNRAFKDWPEIFNNDSTLTAALLDRLLHHTETVLIEGKSYRMKETIES